MQEGDGQACVVTQRSFDRGGGGGGCGELATAAVRLRHLMTAVIEWLSNFS